MALVVHRRQMGEIDPGVHLGGGERAVTEEFLNRPQVHPRFQQVGCKRVPQGVWMEPVEIGGPLDGGVEPPADRSIGQTAAPLVDEDRIFIAFD